MGVEEADFAKPRSPEEIRNIFAKAGQYFDDEQFKQLCDEAVRWVVCRPFADALLTLLLLLLLHGSSSGYGSLSVGSFRSVWTRQQLEMIAQNADILPPSVAGFASPQARASFSSTRGASPLVRSGPDAVANRR